MQMNQSPIRFGIVALLLMGVLSACPATGGGAGPTISTITIAGVPSDNNLKMNVPTTLTATAKDSSGAVVAGTAFTWVSSNPDAVSVDASGVVTARKFGDAVITVSSGGVSAATASQKTYGLEAVFGTVVDNRITDVNLGVLYRFRPKFGGVPATTDISYTITGPAGWNNGAALPDTDTFAAQSVIYRFFGFDVAAVAGNYKMTLTYNAETFDSQSRAVDANSKVPITNITVSSASASDLTASWTAVATAQTYYLQAVNGTDGSSSKNSAFSANLSATITGLALDMSKTPVVVVRSLSFPVAFTPTEIYPSQFNLFGSDSPPLAALSFSREPIEVHPQKP